MQNMLSGYLIYTSQLNNDASLSFLISLHGANNIVLLQILWAMTCFVGGTITESYHLSLQITKK